MSADPDTILAHAIRVRAVLGYLGVLSIALLGIPIVPALFGLAFGNVTFAARAGASAGLLLAIALVLLHITRPRDLQGNEALAVVALGYVAAAAVMVWPLVGDGLRWEDAVFHAVSAVTTTGLTTANSLEARSQSFLFALAWGQWYGGLVILVLAVFVVGPGLAAKRLLASEKGDEDVLTGNMARAVHALIIYGGLTIIAILVLRLLGASWFDSLVHALSALSTGGFSSHDDSLAGLGSWPVQPGVMVFALAGAISSARYQNLLGWAATRRRGLAGFFDSDLLVLLALCGLLTLVVGLTLRLEDGMAWLDVARQAPLLAISAQTTTGFTPLPVPQVGDSAKLAMIAAMFVGGDLGSTAGGIKIIRLLVILALLRFAVLRPALPQHAVARPRVGGKPLHEADVWPAVGIVSLFLLVILLGWMAFLAYGHPALDALFEVVSATSTVGLSAGIASPDLDPALKGVLCLCMWMGRLEVLAVIILVSPHSWLGRREPIQ